MKSNSNKKLKWFFEGRRHFAFYLIITCCTPVIYMLHLWHIINSILYVISSGQYPSWMNALSPKDQHLVQALVQSRQLEYSLLQNCFDSSLKGCVSTDLALLIVQQHDMTKYYKFSCNIYHSHSQQLQSDSQID